MNKKTLLKYVKPTLALLIIVQTIALAVNGTVAVVNKFKYKDAQVELAQTNGEIAKYQSKIDKFDR